MYTIDINTDIGESFGNWTLGDDDGMFRSVSSANVACGFHAGDPTSILKTCEKAVEAGVAIGAHVGYRDLAGFGRRYIDYKREDLANDVLYQIGALDSLVQTTGARVTYVKPHGALNNTIMWHHDQAAAVLDGVAAFNRPLTMLLMPQSVAGDAAHARGMRVAAEAFGDRRYHTDGSLVSRKESNAMIRDPNEIAENMVQLVKSGTLPTVEGDTLHIQAESICLHSDTYGAVESGERLAKTLHQEDIRVAPFATT